MVLWTSVSEAAVHEHRDLRSGKHKVRSEAPVIGQWGIVDSVAESRSVYETTDSQLRL